MFILIIITHTTHTRDKGQNITQMSTQY